MKGSGGGGGAWKTEAEVNPNRRPGVGIKTDGMVVATYGGVWNRNGTRYDLFKFPGYPDDDSSILTHLIGLALMKGVTLWRE